MVFTPTIRGFIDTLVDPTIVISGCAVESVPLRVVHAMYGGEEDRLTLSAEQLGMDH